VKTLQLSIDPGTVRKDRRVSVFRRYVLASAVFALLPPVVLAAVVIGVDPYYTFGSPKWRGINAVRPYYEARVLVAKPYQVWRLRPSAVALGSSRVEVAIDPRHPGWTKGVVFNFALPSSNSYEVTLAFLHAQQLGAPLKQAVAGLDFFAYNINFPLAADLSEHRFAGGIGGGLVDFLDGIIAERRRHSGAAALRAHTARPESGWDEALYLAVNADVAAAVAGKAFTSGRQHYELAGRTERREGGTVPGAWDERGYLQVHRDVAAAVSQGRFLSGYHHFLAAGRQEERLGGFQPPDWDEASYLAANPDVRIRVALGDYRTGYLHFAALGRKQGRLGGFPPSNAVERMRLRWPSLSRLRYRLEDLFVLVFSMSAAHDAVSTMMRQSEPASFDDAGVRVWHGQETYVQQLGGTGSLMRKRLISGPWSPTLVAPTLIYCFDNPETGLSTFDPFRFMVRRAYAAGTDLRLYTTPLHESVRAVIAGLGLAERYEFWLKELVRINEEEAARAGRPPFPLWDFSDSNSITREPIPPSGDVTPMHWYWELSHYRKETGDLILDRIFGTEGRLQRAPADFGVRLTGANVDAHEVHSKRGLAEWASANAGLASQIADATRSPNPGSHQGEAACW
jgi:hypothetical protein